MKKREERRRKKKARKKKKKKERRNLLKNQPRSSLNKNGSQTSQKSFGQSLNFTLHHTLSISLFKGNWETVKPEKAIDNGPRKKGSKKELEKLKKNEKKRKEKRENRFRK